MIPISTIPTDQTQQEVNAIRNFSLRRANSTQFFWKRIKRLQIFPALFRMRCFDTKISSFEMKYLTAVRYKTSQL